MSSTEPTSSIMPEDPSLVARCHCGLVTLTLPWKPTLINECQCSICYRYGAQWAYYDLADVVISASSPEDPLRAYCRSDAEGRGKGFWFCGRCGCLMHWAGVKGEEKDCPDIGVNTRMLPMATVEGVRKKVTTC